ncbi:MAG: C2 family cysteine protease [Cyanobacteriota bacterium]|nr:C2 family cysteine protease [Cyanobacteriota bacterium]
MSSINFFDLTDGIDRFVIDGTVPTGVGIRGLNGADVILGFTSADIVYGNDGADEIAGGSEADTLQGGRGTDLLFGNAGADYLQGERGNDVIFGGQGNDLLFGNAGDDFLAGDAGFDTLVGGDGSDAFVLDTRHTVSDPAVADIITDFNRDNDGDVFALTDGAGDALAEADLTLEADGSDTLVRLTATGGILARVQGASPDLLAGAFSTASATIDDTEPGAQVLGLVPGGNTLSGFVGDEDYLDFFQFQVTEASIIDFSLSGMSADADLLVYQDLNDDGELGGDEIISASERSGTADETVENVTLDPGKYFLAVEQYEGDTNYNLSINGVAGTVARDLAGDRPSTARALPPDGEVELHDYVGGTDAVDTYQLEVLNGGYLDLFTDYQFEGVDLELTLWSDLNGNDQFDADEAIARGTNEIEQDSIGQGTYYINVTAPGEATPYEIAAISSAGSRVGIESHDPLFPGITTTGTLDRNDEFDPFDLENYADPYLLPELGTGLTVTVTQESEDFDAYLTVVDLLTGDVVAENNDIDIAGENFNAQVSFTTELGGQYIVYASSVDAPGFGDYTLNAAVAGTPIETDPRRNRNDSLLPPPVFNEQGNRADTGLQNDTTHNLVYQPLTDGQLDSIILSNLNQGNFGDCAFLAAMGATFGKIEDPSAAASNVSSVLDDAISVSDDTYTITFYDYQTGQQSPVTVDNQVVTKQQNQTINALFGAKWTDGATSDGASGQPVWAPVFERAYAKWRGEQTGRNGYDVIGNGDLGGIALRRMTGQKIEEIIWNPSQSDPQYSRVQFEETLNYTPLGSTTPDDIFQGIQNALDNGRYVTTGTVSDAEQQSGGVIIGGHAYSVHNAYEDNGQKMILVRNPWGIDNNKDVTAPNDPSSNTKDGFVAITYETFLKNFSTVSLSQG